MEIISSVFEVAVLIKCIQTHFLTASLIIRSNKMGKSRCGVPGCETLTNSCDNLFRLPESEEVLKELGFPDQFENLEDFRVCSQHFTADSFQLSGKLFNLNKNILHKFSFNLDSGKKKLSTNPKVKTNVKFDHSESFDEQEIDLAAWAIPVCQLKVESIDKSSSKLKEFCQFCLKEQKDDCFKKLLDDELQESFFDLTRKKVRKSRFSLKISYHPNRCSLTF